MKTWCTLINLEDQKILPIAFNLDFLQSSPAETNGLINTLLPSMPAIKHFKTETSAVALTGT